MNHNETAVMFTNLAILPLGTNLSHPIFIDCYPIEITTYTIAIAIAHGPVKEASIAVARWPCAGPAAPDHRGGELRPQPAVAACAAALDGGTDGEFRGDIGHGDL